MVVVRAVMVVDKADTEVVKVAMEAEVVVMEEAEEDMAAGAMEVAKITVQVMVEIARDPTKLINSNQAFLFQTASFFLFFFIITTDIVNYNEIHLVGIH